MNENQIEFCEELKFWGEGMRSEIMSWNFEFENRYLL